MRKYVEGVSSRKRVNRYNSVNSFDYQEVIIHYKSYDST